MPGSMRSLVSRLLGSIPWTAPWRIDQYQPDVVYPAASIRTIATLMSFAVESAYSIQCPKAPKDMVIHFSEAS